MKAWSRLRISPRELRQFQNQKLHRFINEQLYPFSPFYRKLFDQNRIDPRKIRTVADLKHIPFSGKQDLLPTPENPQLARDFILQPDEDKIKQFWPLSKKMPLLFQKVLKGNEFVQEMIGAEYRPIFLIATTGRTTAPVSFLYSDYDIRNLRLAGARMVEVFGLTPEDRGVNIFPYAPHLAFWQVALGGFESKIFLLSTGGGKALGTEGNLNAMEKLSPTLLLGVPGYVYHLLRTAKNEGRNLSSVKKVVLGAEKVPLGLKEKMSELLREMGASDVQVMGTYGFTEARLAWGECPTDLHISSGYHTYPDLEIFEIINPETGEPVAEGEKGEIVYTNIDSRGSCVLRYRTNDITLGGMTLEPCPHCGRTVPRIDSNIIRVSNIKAMNLTKIKGTQVDLNKLALILGDIKEIDEWQIEIRKKDDDPYEIDELILYIALHGNPNLDALRALIKEKFFTEEEITPTSIVVLPLEDILRRMGMETEMKEKRFLDRRPK